MARKFIVAHREKQKKTKFHPQPETSEQIQFLGAVLFIAAFCIRLYHIDDPPLDFHPGRQYQCALIARSMYLDASKSAPQWRVQLAKLNRERVPRMELPIIEFIASIAYRIAGGEHLWIPRLTSSIFCKRWML